MSHPVHTQNHPRSLEDWSKILCEQDMPIFSKTACDICTILDDPKKGAMELGATIMQDPNLTTKLLKVSNSTYYNPSKQKMKTVSRAIVILGAKNIRQLTLACSFLEAILTAKNKERANQEIADAIHAATQAKTLATATNDPCPEEIFIATLLHKIGYIAFWSFNNNLGDEITKLIDSGHFSEAQAEKKILGFELQELSEKLCKTWYLSGIIEQSITQGDQESSDKRIQLVQLGHEINESLKEGWESEAFLNCMEKVIAFSKQGERTVLTMLKQSSKTAINIARQFGAEDAVKFMVGHKKNAQNPPLENEEPIEAEYYREQINRHLSNENIRLNVVFDLILKGIHKGLAMDRTLIFFLNSRRDQLQEKLSLGWHNSTQSEKIRIRKPEKTNLLFHVLQTAEPLWVDPNKHPGLYDEQLLTLFDKENNFTLPIISENKRLGVIYCDRSRNTKPLTQEDFDEAIAFVEQLESAMSLFRKHNL